MAMPKKVSERNPVGRPCCRVKKTRLQCYIAEETFRIIDGLAFARSSSRGEILDLMVRNNNKL
jgi:hypothetical protein